MLLLAATQERLGHDAVRMGYHLKAWEQTGSEIKITFTDRSGEAVKETITSQCLVAADGIHSEARAALYPRSSSERSAATDDPAGYRT